MGASARHAARDSIPQMRPHSNVKGQSTCASFMLFTTFLAICLRKLLWSENKKLDKKYGTLAKLKVRAAAAGPAGEIDDQKVTVVGEENYGPMYLYVP